MKIITWSNGFVVAEKITGVWVTKEGENMPVITYIYTDGQNEGTQIPGNHYKKIVDYFSSGYIGNLSLETGGSNG